MSVIGALLSDVEAAGISIRLEPPDLVVKPAERLTPKLEARLKAHKPELVRLLEAELRKADVLNALISVGTWRTTKQLAEAVNLPARDVIPVLELLHEAGFIERDSEPLLIWKAGIESRIRHHCIRIAIDRRTGSALLLFKVSDSDIVKAAADVYEPFEIELTHTQRAELTGSLDYYERLSRRNHH